MSESFGLDDMYLLPRDTVCSMEDGTYLSASLAHAVPANSGIRQVSSEYQRLLLFMYRLGC
jgi:hypothetical protein